MPTFYSPTGNPEIWDEKPNGYFTPEEWFEAHPPEKPVIDLERAIAQKIAEINDSTMRMITAGFTYSIGGQKYHFGYDADDQVNFTKAALSAVIAMQQGVADYRQAWRGWVGDTPHTLSLTADEFLGLATFAGKDHQEGCLASGWAITERLRLATTIEELDAIVDDR